MMPSAEIARQAVVDIGGRDGSVTCCNRDLVKVWNGVSDGVQSRHVRPLMCIELETPDCKGRRPAGRMQV
jgi:hypothetical protein